MNHFSRLRSISLLCQCSRYFDITIVLAEERCKRMQRCVILAVSTGNRPKVVVRWLMCTGPVPFVGSRRKRQRRVSLHSTPTGGASSRRHVWQAGAGKSAPVTLSLSLSVSRWHEFRFQSMLADVGWVAKRHGDDSMYATRDPSGCTR